MNAAKGDPRITLILGNQKYWESETVNHGQLPIVVKPVGIGE